MEAIKKGAHMIIDGKRIAETMLTGLALEVTTLKKGGVTPTLAVILIGDDPASLAYIKQKQKAAEKIGASLIFEHHNASLTGGGLYNLIAKYNSDPAIHGLIVQRPIPHEVGVVTDVLKKVRADKDVDGFLPDSPFDTPVAVAVGEILKTVYRDQSSASDASAANTYSDWLKKKHIVIIGRGETAGEPIFRYFRKQDCTTSQIHSKTEEPENVIREGDIIICCVGKERVVTRDSIKPGAILISVGIRRDHDGKLRGDYDESDIADHAYAYTPTPGGVGPVNVACLMQNLIKACTMSKGGTI